jgi:hypothetical protein
MPACSQSELHADWTEPEAAVPWPELALLVEPEGLTESAAPASDTPARIRQDDLGVRRTVRTWSIMVFLLSSSGIERVPLQRPHRARVHADADRAFGDLAGLPQQRTDLPPRQCARPVEVVRSDKLPRCERALSESIQQLLLGRFPKMSRKPHDLTSSHAATMLLSIPIVNVLTMVITTTRQDQR